MKFLFIVANWKSYKNKFEAIDWVSIVHEASSSLSFENKEVVLCPPYPLLDPIFEYKMDVGSNDRMLLRLGSQNISPYAEGAYTGEVSAKLIREYCIYSIIGHSERRSKFFESDEMLKMKVKLAKENDITPIYCIQGKETVVPEGVSIVAFEPISAIGSGKPDTPEDAQDVAKFVKSQYGVKYVLYGGSVTAENVSSFTSLQDVDGVLVGGESRDAEKFIQIIKNA